MARIMYRDKLLHGSGIQPFLASTIHPVGAEDIQPQGWALKTSKKTTRFSERQKRFLEEKFSIGQETGHKLDAATVAREMRHKMNESGNRLFAVDEFLTPQQMQSYFSRMAAKLKNRHDEGIAEEDITAAEEEDAYSLTRATVIDQCRLTHPVVFESFNLCILYASSGFKKLSIAVLRTMCEHFDFEVGSISRSPKAPYIALLSSLVEECSCTLPKKGISWKNSHPPPHPPIPGRHKPCNWPSKSIGSGLQATGHRSLNFNKYEKKKKGLELVNEYLLVVASCWKGDFKRLLYVSLFRLSFEKQNIFKSKPYLCFYRLSLLWDGTYLLK